MQRGRACVDTGKQGCPWPGGGTCTVDLISRASERAFFLSLLGMSSSIYVLFGRTARAIFQRSCVRRFLRATQHPLECSRHEPCPVKELSRSFLPDIDTASKYARRKSSGMISRLLRALIYLPVIITTISWRFCSIYAREIVRLAPMALYVALHNTPFALIHCLCQIVLETFSSISHNLLESS